MTTRGASNAHYRSDPGGAAVMGWVRISDDIYDNPKFSLVGPLGVALHVSAMAHCNRNLTDGFIPKGKARLLLDFDGIGVTTAGGELFQTGVDGDAAVRLVLGWMVAADLLHESGHDCDECHARPDGGEPHSGEYLIHDYLKYQRSKAEVLEKRDDLREQRSRAGRAGGLASAATRASKSEAKVKQTVKQNPSKTPSKNEAPTPTPTPLKEGGLIIEVSQEGPPPEPPPCRKHPQGNAEVPCAACGRRRQWHEAQAAAATKDELEQKRLERERAKACPHCAGTNLVDVGDNQVRKCNHEEGDRADYAQR